MKNHKKIIALDIGGTKIQATRYSWELKEEKTVKLLTHAKGYKKRTLASIDTAIDMVRQGRVGAIVIAWPGVINKKTGKVAYAPNVPNLVGFNLAGYLRKKYKVPIMIENDSNLFSLAEFYQGNARGKRSVFGIIVGTGIGCGLAIDGCIVKGSHGYFGEVGHTININTKQTFEKDLAAPGLKRYFKKKIGIGSLREIEALSRKKNKKVLKAFNPILDKYAILFYNIQLMYDPDVIVVGGGVGHNILNHFKSDLNSRIKKLQENNVLKERIDLRFSKMENAGCLGAAILVKSK